MYNTTHSCKQARYSMDPAANLKMYNITFRLLAGSHRAAVHAPGSTGYGTGKGTTRSDRHTTPHTMPQGTRMQGCQVQERYRGHSTDTQQHRAQHSPYDMNATQPLHNS